MKAQVFFQELQRILYNIPKAAARIESSENCEYCDNVYYSQNLLFCFDMANCKDSYFTYDSYMAIQCVDCDYAVECESCYESVDTVKCFNCDFLFDCLDMRDSMHCHNCHNCHDVFGCVNLANKSYCIFNRQLSEEEYKQLLPKYKSLPKEKINEIILQIKSQHPRRQVKAAYNENSPYGNYIYHNKNCYLSFDAGHNENCAYLYDSFYNRYSMDMTYASRYNEQAYEIVESNKINESAYVVNSDSCRNSFYLFDCKGVTDSIGCVGLRSRRFCILNRQLSEEEYKSMSQDLFRELSSAGWGWSNIKIY